VGSINKKDFKMTPEQRKALHLYCEMLASALNNAGYDMKKTLKEEVEIPWQKMMVKEHLWKPIEKVVTDKDSTEEMTNKEVNEIYRVLDRHISQKFGVSVPFPSIRG